MKMGLTLCALACTMMTPVAYAQDVEGVLGPRRVVSEMPQGGMGHSLLSSAAASESGTAHHIVDAARRAALRLAIQPNTRPQQSGRSAREWLGFTWIVAGGAMAVLAYTNSEFGEGEKLTFGLIGAGLGGIGGYLVASADSTSRVRLGGARPGGRLAIQPVRGGATVVHKTQF